MKKINKSTIITIAITLGIGLVLGRLFFGGQPSGQEYHEHTGQLDKEETVWTCSMHPQVRQNEPGQCPICGMDLIPLANVSNEGGNSPYELEMTEAAMKIADIQTTLVQKKEPEKTVYMLGRVMADERRIYKIPAHFHGRLEKLYVNFTGEYMSKGEILALVYSPDLITAQQELLEVLPYKESNPAMYRAARNKLKNWKIASSEIDKIEQTREVMTELPVRAHHAGVVWKRNVAVGDHVSMGDILFEVIDLSHLWVMFDAHESDLPWINLGNQIKFTLPSVPGKTFKSKISFIDPVINSSTRVAGVRAELDNPGNLLKPEMFAQGIVEAVLPGAKEALVIPKSAVLWTGKRAVVYVKDPHKEKPVFEFRQIDLGADAGDQYVVASGLSEGEEIVTNGVFKIDAAAQLQGNVSMMNPPLPGTQERNPEEGIVPGERKHSGMGMRGGQADSQSPAPNSMNIADDEVPAQFYDQ